MQSQDEGSSLPLLGASPDFAVVRLHDLVDDGEAESGATLKVGLKGLEDFFDLLRSHAGTGVGESDLPVFAERFKGHGECASAFHGTNGIFTNIPENLL